MAKPRKPKNEEHKPENSDDAIVQHQKLCLAIDMDNRRIYGYTELKVVVPESGHVGLHADNMTIEAITVDGEPAEFEFFPHYQFVDDERRWSSVSSATSASGAASSSYISSLEKEMAPNLQILCKSGTGDQQQGQQQQTDALNNSQTSTELKQNVGLIRIDYLIQNPETGIHFGNNVVHTDNQIRRAHCWFPCMENSSQRCCYDLEFTVAQNLVVVSNGTLLYQVLSKDDPPRRTYVYRLGVPVTAGWISLAVAPFEVFPDLHSGVVSHMCLSANLSKLRNTVTFFHNSFSHYEDYLASTFPFGSYKQVFIAPEIAISSITLGASMSIFSSQVLFDEKVIDQTIDTRIKLAYALARQWFGVYINAESPNDEWLLEGLAGFLTDSFIKRFLGNNEARYRRYKANFAVCKADVSGATALSSSASCKDLYGTQCIGIYGKIRSWKSVAVLQMLEKQMGPESFRKILQNIILRAKDTNRSLRSLSTKEFRHFSNKVGNLERPFLKEFFPRWVGSSGCPVLRTGFSYNKRKNMIEMAVWRGCTVTPGSVFIVPSGNPTDSREADVGWPGMMSIRVYELDGMYDHPILPMAGEAWQLIEIQCHSKLAARRIQKPKKGTKPDGSDDNCDTPATDMRPSVESPLLWLRADPEMEYLAEIHFNQPIQMWINQLEKDRDVVAQAQAIATLEALPHHSFSVVNALNNFLCDSKAFWRVRIEAAYALAHSASEDTDWAGLLDLIKFYKGKRFDASIGLPRPNDFHDFPEYFVLEAIPHAVAMVRAADNKSPREVVEFVLQLLKYNDNNGNHYSDVYWLAALVQSIGELEFGQQSILLLSSLLKCIDRLLQFDRLMPSYNGVLAISCIRTLTQIALKLSSSLPLDRVPELIKPYRNIETLWKVRAEASRSLIDLEFHSNGIDAALLLFMTYLEEEASLRGQVKLAMHTLRLCQIRSGSGCEDEVNGSTLVALLRLLESRKAFNNVFLRHHLFCILQILAGRPPTLYGVPRTVAKPSGDAETCSEQTVKLKNPNPPLDPLPDARNMLRDDLPIPEVPKEIDTVSIGSERRMPVVRIKVKQSGASSRAEETDNIVVDLSHGVKGESERGGSSSMSVDAPPRAPDTSNQILEEVNSFHDLDSRMTASIGSAKLVNTEDEIRNELQCTADSKKVVPQPEPEDRSSPNMIKGNNGEPDAQKYVSLQTLSAGRYDHGSLSAGRYDRDGHQLPLIDPNSQEKRKKEKKRKGKGKDKKRKREDRDKGHHDDPEYMERKRLKKEKKLKEKKAKPQGGDARVSFVDLDRAKDEPGVRLALQLKDKKSSALEVPGIKEEPRVQSASVQLKPNEPGGSKKMVIKTVEAKGEGSEGSSVQHKLRIKIKNRSLNKS